MKLVEYLNQLGSMNGVEPDVKKQQRMPLVDRIVEILTPAYLRLESLDQATKDMLRAKVELSIQKKAPITLILAVGGFKGVKVPGSPHINWAEVFHADFLIKTLGEIALIYPPGLVLEFSGDDVIVPLMNNYKPEWTKIYNAEFDKILAIIADKLPANIKLTNRPASSFYKREELEKEVESAANEKKYTDAEWEVKLKHAVNNFVWEGERDLRKAKNKSDLLRRSVAVHDAWLDVDYQHRREYLEGGINIPIIHKKGLPGCYGIRSVRSSDVQFWEAEGVLQKDGERWVQQLRSVKGLVGGDFSTVKTVKTVFAGLQGIEKINIL